MVSKATSSSSSKSRKSHGEDSSGGTGSLLYKLNQLKRQIQADRVVSIKEKVAENRKKAKTYISNVISATSNRNALNVEENGRMLSLRMRNPLWKDSGYFHGLGDRDANIHDVVFPSSIKIPYIELLPTYTTWIFLDRNQRMAEDQSVVGRRRIYYDEEHGSEALICSDSEEDIAEPEEEKREFTEGEDRLVWTIAEDYGLGEEVAEIVSQFIGATVPEIEERYSFLKEKYKESEQNLQDSELEKGIALDKSLSDALDSFDNLFCRRCLLFDCGLHGCSQTLIHPSEKQPYWSEYEDDRKPCSDQCYLWLKALKDVPQGSGTGAMHGTMDKSLEDKDNKTTQHDAEDADPVQVERGILEEEAPGLLEGECGSEVVGTNNLETPSSVIGENESSGKRKCLQDMNTGGSDIRGSDDIQDCTSKKQKTTLGSDIAATSEKAIGDVDNTFSARNLQLAVVPSESETQINNQEILKELVERMPDNTREGTKDIIGVPDLKILSTDWKPIERELYLKGVEIFGRNSCLIARNLLSGLKSCIEVSAYMSDGGASTLNRSIVPSSLFEEKGKSESDLKDQEMSSRPRLFRRKGKTRKLKYSWKSAGHPSMWKRMADGKNKSCVQYTPCGCQSMCGKQCSCLQNGTCCEKYCGCSKSCKNRFRGCHCAKSQCRSRQCPCFAAGRECDPDVCRNCWVSCGGGSLGEPPKRGEGQCGNMRLLLRQQQRILLGRSDVAGWGAFLKNSVNKNDYLGEYTGELISHYEADKRGKIYDLTNSSFLFDLNDQYVLDAYRKGDKLKFANHSSDPNCYAKVMLVAGDHRVGIFAKEHIEASEELFYDYRYGPEQAPIWARKPESSRRVESSASRGGRARKHHSH